MFTFSKSSAPIMDRMFLLVGMFLLMFALPVCAQPSSLSSPDNKYQAEIVSDNGSHYRVKELDTGRVVLTTTAQYPSANDVKAGMFSPDSKEFAAAYHYGHKGPYTWIGVWQLTTGKRVQEEEKNGWTKDISFVFEKK